MRSKEPSVAGMVNFPLRPDSTRDGTYVELWVIDVEYITTHYSVSSKTNYDTCCGVGCISTLCQEELAGVDVDYDYLGFTIDPENGLPWMLACVTMGSSNWANNDWKCTYDDLNHDGKAVYDALKAAYPKAKLALVTWIDT
jgi:hypothetical protein